MAELASNGPLSCRSTIGCCGGVDAQFVVALQRRRSLIVAVMVVDLPDFVVSTDEAIFDWLRDVLRQFGDVNNGTCACQLRAYRPAAFFSRLRDNPASQSC